MTSKTPARCPYTGHVIRRMSDFEARVVAREIASADVAREVSAAWVRETREPRSI